MLTLSWKRYDEQYQLSDLLTEAARACVDARASNPGAFLASYFTKVTSGDSVDTMECDKVYTPQGEIGLSVQIRLFTNASVSTTAFFTSDSEVQSEKSSHGTSIVGTTNTVEKQEEGGALIGPLVSGARSLHNYLNSVLIPEIRQIGVSKQNEWDDIVEEARWEGFSSVAMGELMGEREQRLPASLAYAVSLAASIVAAKSAKASLHTHFGALYAAQRPITMLGTKPHHVHKPGIPSDHYTCPRLLLPFFGRSDATAITPPGTVCFQTFYLLPATPASVQKPSVSGEETEPAAAPEPPVADVEEPVNPKGIITEEVYERLIIAYRIFRERNNNPQVRQDGAYVYVNVENIIDAVQLAAEVVTAAGLKPGVDVSFGVRVNCPVTHHNPEAVAASTAPSGKGKRPPKDQGKIEEVMYTLFSGDPEVTGSQVAEYLTEQVQGSNGLLVFLEDTHDSLNVAGIHRLMARLGDSVILSGRSMYATPANVDREKMVEKVETGITSMWSNNFALPVREIGNITRIMGLTKLLEVNHRSFTLVARSDDREVIQVIDLGLGVSAGFVIVGGLTTPSTCDTLSHYIRIQQQLLQQRELNDQPSLASQITFLGDLPPLSDEPVAEIKRKNDKKKKKQPGKH